MIPGDDLLREPSDRGVRIIALSLLSDARHASGKLADAEGEGARDHALHDFRVAVRRLRSWLRAFDSTLDNALSRKQRRRLREVAAATGAARDAAVHLEWLLGERRGMGVRQQVGERWLRERLTKRRADGMKRALAAATEFDSLSEKLERRLEHYCRSVSQPEPQALCIVVAARLRKESETLRARLASIGDHTDHDESHRARIAAKRVRYVIEPVAAMTSDGASIIGSLKTLQDSLGELHDTHVFSREVLSATLDDHRDARPGLARTARRLDERGGRAYEAVSKDWLGDASAPFIAELRELASDIERRAS